MIKSRCTSITNMVTTQCWGGYLLLPTRLVHDRTIASWQRCFNTTSRYQAKAKAKPSASEAEPMRNDSQKWQQKNPELTERSFKAIAKSYNRLLKQITGQEPVRLYRSVESDIQYMKFHLSGIMFRLPAGIERRWGVSSMPREEWVVALLMDVVDGPHMHKWSLKSIETDDACRLGIRLQYKHHEPEWLTSNMPVSVAYGNAFVDLLTGKIGEVNSHVWATNRYPIMGPWFGWVSTKSWEMFSDPAERRAALSKGETLQPQWRPTKSYLNYFKNTAKQEENQVPLTSIDPLGQPPPYKGNSSRMKFLKSSALDGSTLNR